MAANQLLATLPMVSLDAGCTITVEAIDPASGAAVTGVTVSQVTIYAPGGGTISAFTAADFDFTHAVGDT